MFGHVKTTLSVVMQRAGARPDIRYNGRSTEFSYYREAMFIQMHLQPAPSLDFDICYEVNICRFFERSFLYTILSPP